MTYYVVKVVDEHGWLRPPIVANFSSEEQAIQAVKLMVGDNCAVEIKAQRDDAMKAAFGEIPEGAAAFRDDWTWRGDEENTPEPY